MRESLIQLLQVMKKGQQDLRIRKAEAKNQVLLRMADRLHHQMESILRENEKDLKAYQEALSGSTAFLDRLTLTEGRLRHMIQSLHEVAQRPDPVGALCSSVTLSNGLELKQVRSPLGVIFLIFEARPNVITEAFSLAFKAGNGLILKGGKESNHTSQILYRLIQQTLVDEGFDPGVFWGLADVDRSVTDFLMRQHRWIDVLIPRGGDRLIEYVSEHSSIPIIKNDRGLCHSYIHKMANLTMALNLVENGKTQRPSVCNALETLLVDEALASSWLPLIYEHLTSKGVIFYACPRAYALLSGKAGVHPAGPQSFDTEYLELKLNVAIVDGVEEAMAHIERHGSRHSELIVTECAETAKRFQAGVDAAVVYWNASTRFTDGGQMGLGAEIGISTQKLHVRGPVGLESLTSIRWVVEGHGQVRPNN